MKTLTYEDYSAMHIARSALYSDAWYAARKLPKEDRKIERAMLALADDAASEVIEEMFFPGGWRNGSRSY